MEILQISSDAFKILLFLFPGYIAFRLYFIDKPWSSMGAIHVFYGSLSFSIISYFLFSLFILMTNHCFPGINIEDPILNSMLSIPFAALSGILWRLYGHNSLHKFLSEIKLTNEDNNSTPWMQLFNNVDIRLSQITVYLKNGKAFRCDETAYFDTKEWRKVGIYSHYTHSNGDLYFIATHQKENQSQFWKKIPDLHIDSPWGVKIQWIPRSEICHVEVRAIEIT